MIIPPHIKRGEKIAVIAPSSPVKPERLESGCEFLRSIGLEPVVYPSCSASHGYFAGDDGIRAGDIMSAFLDPSIKAIMCARGGYGSQRLLPMLGFKAISAHPKPFFGYSDITALHAAFSEICGFISYHAPMSACELRGEPDKYTAERFIRVLFGEMPDLSQAEGHAVTAITSGEASGRLIGGNLSLVASSIGTPWQADFKDAILFIEDVDEKPYTVDRMLTQLRNSGALASCRGIALGYFTDTDSDDPGSLKLADVFYELLAPLGIPVYSGITSGHETPTMTLPIGAKVKLSHNGLEYIGI